MLTKNNNVGLAGLPGTYLPPTKITTAELIEELGICYPDSHEDPEKRGKPLPLTWAEEYFGIRELPRDYRWVIDENTDLNRHPRGRLVKPLREEGGLYGVDLGVNAARIALNNAGLEGVDIGLLIEVTATPDTIALNTHQAIYYHELGMSGKTQTITLGIGCAGFFDALKIAEAYLHSRQAKYVLAIFQNCPSAPLATPMLREGCKHNLEAFACHMAFADGAVACIFKLVDGIEEGFLAHLFDHRFGADFDLMKVIVGGNFHSPTKASAYGAGYRMNGKAVKKAFVKLMLENYDRAPNLYEEVGLGDYSPQAIESFVLHQASKPAILSTLDKRPEIPRDHVPMIMGDKGNLAVASGPYALTERLAQSARGSLHVIMLLGSSAGGAGYGTAIYRKNF